MTQNASFIRKIIYVATIAVLLFPLFRLGQPASRDSTGGMLAVLRTQHGLAQAELGDIDPACETMKLATLGMRGVAANILWEKANDYKMREDWDNLSATLNQITKLQPNFIKVWEFQAHNLSYNVSVEFDDFRHRYHWVKKGIDFLIEGTFYNADDPTLLWYIGWFVSHKIGTSDEHEEFRELFRNDKDYHKKLSEHVDVEGRDALGPDARPDNWRVAKLWYNQAEDAVDRKGKPLRGKSPLVFHADSARALVGYAMAIETEGYLDDVAEIAWQRAGEAWRTYGLRELPTTWNHVVRLATLNDVVQDYVKRRRELDDLVPGLRDKILEDRRAAMTPTELAAMEKPVAERTEQDWPLVIGANEKLKVYDKDVADQLPTEFRQRGRHVLAARLIELQTLVEHTDKYRGVVNYGYWEMRCNAEQKHDAVQARKHVYEAERRLKNADPVNAKAEFELAWDHWAKLFEEHPLLMEDVTGEDLNKDIDKYESVLLQMGEPGLPSDFKLKDFRNRQKKALAENEANRQPTPTTAATGVREVEIKPPPNQKKNDDE